jgi:hypothetical protein
MKLSNKKVVYIAAGLLLSVVSMASFADEAGKVNCALPEELMNRMQDANTRGEDITLSPQEKRKLNEVCPKVVTDVKEGKTVELMISHTDEEGNPLNKRRATAEAKSSSVTVRMKDNGDIMMFKGTDSYRPPQSGK